MSFFKQFLFKLFPKTFVCLAAKKSGVDKRLDASLKLFDGTKRIDFFPLTGGQLGFMLIIDNSFSLWFYQDNDRFVFDGYEIGEYENGDVTVLDSCLITANPFK